jgi:hypothetical protein
MGIKILPISTRKPIKDEKRTELTTSMIDRGINRRTQE